MAKHSAKKSALPKAAEAVGFSETERAFFAVGDDSQMLAASAVAQIPDPPAARPSFWRRLFSRTQRN